MIRTTKAIQVLLASLIALFALAAPALAHHKDGHTNGGGKGQSASSKDNDGDADSDSSTAYTEDNDTNDGGTPNNVPDDGDNAHPSGKDRSVEKGGSGNQGKAESDPDDDGRGPDRSNGGPDKPNGSGGVDKADQDGNNGCGNDDDFEDDNEGWCGGKPKPVKPAEPDQSLPVNVPSEPIQPNQIDVAPDLDTDEAGPGDEVQGLVVTKDAAKPGQDVLANRGALGAAAGSALPFTGGSVIYLVIAGLGLVAAGLTGLVTGRRS